MWYKINSWDRENLKKKESTQLYKCKTIEVIKNREGSEIQEINVQEKLKEN